MPRYDGISDWDQYREVFEAIVASIGWDDLTAALQLIAHLDGEALNVALLVPDDQRKRPGVLIETLTAHYTTPGRLAKHRRQFEQMQRPPGEDPAAFAIALETLARRAFVDVDPAIRLQLVRDNSLRARSNWLCADIWIVWVQTPQYQASLINAASGRVTRRVTLDLELNVNRERHEECFKYETRLGIIITKNRQNRTVIRQNLAI